MDESSKKIQESFISRIKASVAQNVSLVEEMADLLEMSNDSAYRRIRGETLLSITEIARLSTYFKVPFDNDVNHLGNKVTFDYKRLDHNKENFRFWLESLRNDVKRISSRPENTILYAADDVPIWHHFSEESLIAFKLFYWLKTILCDKDYVDESFDEAMIPKELIETAKELLSYYDQTNSSEIWTEDTLNSTLKQVEYFWESGFFKSKEDALKICKCIENEMTTLKKKAAASSKVPNGRENFKMYRSEVMVGNNSVLVNIAGTKLAYVSYNTFNVITTTNTEFVQETEDWLVNLTKKSILISGVSEKQRNQFFKILFDKIETLRSKINI